MREGTFVEVSALHLPLAELRSIGEAPVICYKGPHGAWVWLQHDDTHEQDAMFEEDGRFPVLLDIMQVLRSTHRSVEWILFDEDAPLTPDWPAFV